MRLTRSYPEIENLDILEKFYSQGKPAMFVANHCSWMDIPFLGATVGWRNYKLVSKKELGIVPVLGTSIKVGGHIMVDRTDRKSQVRTLKQGINYLKVQYGQFCEVASETIDSYHNFSFLITNRRTAFTCAHFQKAQGHVQADSWRSKMGHSRWPTKLVPRSSHCQLSIRTK